MRHVFFYSTHDARAAGTLEDATASNVLQLSCYIFYNPKRDEPNRGDHVDSILKLLNQAFEEFCKECEIGDSVREWQWPGGHEGKEEDKEEGGKDDSMP